jgi:hypothetical protein
MHRKFNLVDTYEEALVERMSVLKLAQGNENLAWRESRKAVCFDCLMSPNVSGIPICIHKKTRVKGDLLSWL